jgi:hypothetical protein
MMIRLLYIALLAGVCVVCGERIEAGEDFGFDSDLAEIVVTGSSPAEATEPVSASQGVVLAERLEDRPLLRPGEVLEVVPGLIVAQHSGDGKANQYFLRGFNLDHGTDFATRVDGVPVNLPTHAHGQGYTDLNFLIPELVERIEYKKGVYYADEGDFSAAGAADVLYRRQLDAPFLQLTGGQEGYRRVVGAVSGSVASSDLMLGAQYSHTDGPWTLPEGYQNVSAVMKLTHGDSDSGFGVEAVGYSGHWRSTDQIPDRAVADGSISEFGNIDPTDGGKTHRWSVSGNAWHKWGAGQARANAYAIGYGLDLFSNFTYFTDASHGDQFEQYDRRRVYGGAVDYERPLDLFGGTFGSFRAGVQVRRDLIDPVALYDTTERVRWTTVSVTQADVGTYGFFVSQDLRLAQWWRAQVGTRVDAFHNDVHPSISADSGSRSSSIVSPKLNMIFGPWGRTEYFLDVGKGFHSNDARGTTISAPTSEGFPQLTRVTPVAGALGAEVGLQSAVLPRLQVGASVWTLRLNSELTLDNDASMIVPSGATRRYGAEISANVRASDLVLFDADLAWTHARYLDDPAGPYVPNALEKVASLGAEIHRTIGWFGGFRLRYFGSAPIAQDGAARSRPSLQMYGEAGYHFTPALSAVLSAYNLLNRRDRDIEYYYASQLRGEASPVNDVHFHPVDPLNVRMSVLWTFSSSK